MSSRYGGAFCPLKRRLQQNGRLCRPLSRTHGPTSY
jgi:hypothetical protein